MIFVHFVYSCVPSAQCRVWPRAVSYTRVLMRGNNSAGTELCRMIEHQFSVQAAGGLFLTSCVSGEAPTSLWASGGLDWTIAELVSTLWSLRVCPLSSFSSSIGHGGARTVPNYHHSLLPGCHGLHPHVRHHQRGVLQCRARLVSTHLPPLRLCFELGLGQSLGQRLMREPQPPGRNVNDNIGVPDLLSISNH